MGELLLEVQTHGNSHLVIATVAGTMERFDIFAGIKPVLIPGANTFRKPMVSLGMLYYQLKDRL